MISSNVSTIIWRECRYLKNLAPRTLASYEHCFRMIEPFLVDTNGGDVQKAVISLAETGQLNAGGMNIIIRSLRPFLCWLHENGHIPKP
jgi:hypothetical protein